MYCHICGDKTHVCCMCVISRVAQQGVLICMGSSKRSNLLRLFPLTKTPLPCISWSYEIFLTFAQAPESTKSTIMSLWLLTVFFGNLLDAILTKADLLSGLAFFLVFASLMFTVAVLFIWAAVLYKMRECSSETDIAKALTAVQFATQ